VHLPTAFRRTRIAARGGPKPRTASSGSWIFSRPKEFPYATGTGLVYDSGAYTAVLNKALDIADYSSLRDEQRESRKQGRLMGIGISTYGEICAFGPSPYTFAGGWESATVRVEPSGHVTVHTGIKPQGQGEETTFSQIVADQLGVGMDEITIVHGDTAMVQYGLGTFGSRGTAVGGTAMYYAIEELKKKILKYGAMMLESQAVEYAGGKCVCSNTGKEASLAEMRPVTGSRKTSRFRSAPTSWSRRWIAKQEKFRFFVTSQLTIAARSSTR
jgi:carbon-monoxide dehydrogenase large subunit